MTQTAERHDHSWFLLEGTPWQYQGDGTYKRAAQWACPCGEFKTTKESKSSRERDLRLGYTGVTQTAERDPLEELLVDGEAEVAAGRGHWAGEPVIRQRSEHALRAALVAIMKARFASAERLREMAQEALYGTHAAREARKRRAEVAAEGVPAKLSVVRGRNKRV